MKKWNNCKKIKKNPGGGGGGGGGWGGGGRGECERRFEIFVKMQKNKLGVSGWGGIRVDVNKEAKFFCGNKKNRGGGGGVKGVELGGSGWM